MKTVWLIGLLVFVVLYSLWRCWNGNKLEQKAKEVSAIPENELLQETRDLVIETITNMGGDYIEDRNQYIIFSYQGHRFMIEADNECLFLNVYDAWWYRLSLYCDVEEFANLQKVINKINHYEMCTVFYTINKESEEIGVHSKKNMLFIRQIPDLAGYLVSILNDFFKVERALQIEMGKMGVADQNNKR